MKQVRVAARYAKSLLEMSIEQGALETVYADAVQVLQTIKQNRELQTLLKSPVVNSDKKLAILNQLFSGAHPLMQKFLSLVSQKGREVVLAPILESFVAQYRAHKNTLTAVITSAVGLDATMRQEVMSLIKRSTQSEVELIENVDKKLIGGFILRIGDKQVDASVLSKINALRRNFVENPFVKEF